MRYSFGRILSLILAVLCLFSCVSCTEVSTEPGENTDPSKQESEQTKEIVLSASSLSLPDGSAFSLSFSESNELLGGIKSALPSCGNAYLNDLILSTVKERLAAFCPEGATAVAVDVEACYRVEDLYSFGFVLYYDLPENARTVERFYLSADFGGGELMTLGHLIKTAYFENGTVDAYVRAYLGEHYPTAYSEEALSDLLIAEAEKDSFYVAEAGAMLILDAADTGFEKALSCYLSNNALSLYKRKNVTSKTEPESAGPLNYEPAQEGEKVVAMTFDDGPGGNQTKRLLDYLEANQIKATFFVNGYNYSNLEKDENAKALLQRAVSLGCEIGSHSYSHPYFQNLTPEQRTYQLEHNADLIEAACGIYPTLFRAPGGTFPEGMPEQDDYFYIYWSADAEDWARKKDTDNGQSLAQDYLKLIGPGSIVLMHDIYSNSVDAAILIMDALRAQGYRFVTVSELLNLQEKVPDGTIYTSQNGTRKYMSVEKKG